MFFFRRLLTSRMHHLIFFPTTRVHLLTMKALCPCRSLSCQESLREVAVGALARCFVHDPAARAHIADCGPGLLAMVARGSDRVRAICRPDRRVIFVAIVVMT